MQIEHGEKLFEFQTFTDWLNTAKQKFEHAAVRGNRVVAIDQKGRLCGWGEHFMKARDENAFPVQVFLLRADMTLSKRHAQPQPASGENNPGNAGR